MQDQQSPTGLTYDAQWASLTPPQQRLAELDAQIHRITMQMVEGEDRDAHRIAELAAMVQRYESEAATIIEDMALAACEEAVDARVIP